MLADVGSVIEITQEAVFCDPFFWGDKVQKEYMKNTTLCPWCFVAFVVFHNGLKKRGHRHAPTVKNQHLLRAKDY